VPSVVSSALRRLLHGALVLAAVSVLVFLLMQLAPGSYYARMRLNPQLSPRTVAALEAAQGMGAPLPVRYWRWLGSVAAGRWGYSFAYNAPVWPLVRARVAHTLWLTLTALFLAWMLALPLGMWAAWRRGRWDSRAIAGGASLLLALPDVVLALALLALALRTGWFPVGGMHTLGFRHWDRWAQMRDFAWHLCLPVTVLVAGMLPTLVRHVRAAMAEALDAPYIAAARGHGIGEWRLVFGQALPVAANPMLSLLGLSFGALLSGSLLVEVILGWPGLGPLLWRAILDRDPYVVVAAVMLSAALLVGGNMLADLGLAWTDPRLATRGAAAASRSATP
jgi:peptide/nickel transport system permease protein